MNNSHASASNANFNPVTQLTNLDYKHANKLPPLKLQNFNGDPLHFHGWTNNFYSMIHHNASITDTHRITYLQNSVSGKAKDLIHASSCEPPYYQTALNELINHFGDRTIVVHAFINQLENWQVNHQNKQSFIDFSSFLNILVQAFQYLIFIADLQSTMLLKKAKEKVPHNFILKWTEHCLTEFRSDPSIAELQQLLELQAQVYDKVNRENPMRNLIPNSKKIGSSNFNASTAYRNYTSQPLNSLVVNQDRNQKHQLQQSPQPQSTNSSPKSFNVQTYLAKNAKVIWIPALSS